ncbi:MAG TPA: rhomboid family intramembrane serine protease [Candidatus Methanoperedens sp.]
MAKECYYCGFKDPMPFTCKFCGKSFCYNHRLPESHSCPGLAVYKERVRTSGKLSHYEPDMTLKKRRNPVPRSVSRAFSTIRSNYSLTILAVAFISFVLQYIFGRDLYFSYFALFPQDVFYQEWKFALNLVTHIFLHLNFSHLLFNMIFLFFIGPELERRIGGRRFLAVFFLSGVTAGIGYAVWSILNNDIGYAVGASGALFGIFACLVILAPDMYLYIYFVPMKITHALVFFIITDLALGWLLGQADPVGRSAHLTGIAAGLVIGTQIKKKGKYIR